MGQSTTRVEAAPTRATEVQPTYRHYAVVTAVLACFGVALQIGVARAPQAKVPPITLLGPIFALAALIGVVWLLMTLFRNYAVLRNIARAAYYADYKNFAPPDWVERPARTFNNLMQLPTLFWCVCALMMITEQLDAGQLFLAWAFVATRVAHAVIYMVWNYVPARFTSWVAGFIALAAIWVRFGMQSWERVILPGG